MPNSSYKAVYSGSRALVIGINKYKHVPPLAHAVRDAEAVAKVLVDKFDFPKANVNLLVDGNATAKDIRSAFLNYGNDALVEPDDRILVFFAGHGHTVSGRRGEIGFLVPSDGEVADLASLIRWDELTRNADLIVAKHILFLMDACYGGLALQRRIAPGSMRFAKDMLQRYSRQVLTAGKANETVSDGGGVRPGHSIFTAHLLNALEGAASTTKDILTGNRVMSYVYDNVSQDPDSRQTPHFGFLDGDGDFIFDTSPLSGLLDEKTTTDILVPVSPSAAEELSQEDEIADQIKRLISNPNDRILLDDLISRHLRLAIESLGSEKFPASAPVTPEEFAARVRRYEEAILDIRTIVVLLARWGAADQLKTLEKLFARLAELEKPGNGMVVWIQLYWYPVLHLMYAGGLAALSADNYPALRSIFLTTTINENRRRNTTPIALSASSAIGALSDAFKILPEHNRKYFPVSEYLYTALQPPLEDLLLLGRSYESLFDQFETMFALVASDLANETGMGIWGPPGRFAWKYSNGEPDAFRKLVKTGESQGEHWSALTAGFFKQSSARFSEIAKSYEERLGKLQLW